MWLRARISKWFWTSIINGLVNWCRYASFSRNELNKFVDIVKCYKENKSTVKIYQQMNKHLSSQQYIHHLYWTCSHIGCASEYFCLTNKFLDPHALWHVNQMLDDNPWKMVFILKWGPGSSLALSHQENKPVNKTETNCWSHHLSQTFHVYKALIINRNITVITMGTFQYKGTTLPL